MDLIILKIGSFSTRNKSESKISRCSSNEKSIAFKCWKVLFNLNWIKELINPKKEKRDNKTIKREI